jgi:phosphoenolpyruvate-protein kinase (PTS system EI component)
LPSVAHQHGKWVGICGEIASEKDLIERFIHIGVDELSMTPSIIPEIKSFIRSLD